MTHSDLLAGLRQITQTNPLPAPRVIYATPDGRHQIGRAATISDIRERVGREHTASSGDLPATDRWWRSAAECVPGPSPRHTCAACGYEWQWCGKQVRRDHETCPRCEGEA